MEEKRVISSKGQVVVPKPIREYLQLEEGDMLNFCVRETGEVVISPIKTENPEQLFGTLPPKVPTSETHDFENVLDKAKQEKLKKRGLEGMGS